MQLKAPITVKLFKQSNFANLLNLKVNILESVIRIIRPVITFPWNIKHNFSLKRESQWQIGMSSASGSEGPQFKPRNLMGQVTH